MPTVPEWKQSPLYQFMGQIFPGHRTPFNRLDVLRIADELDLRSESVYRWLRCGKIKFRHARKILDLAGKAPNSDLLVLHGRQPPTMEELLPFLI